MAKNLSWGDTGSDAWPAGSAGGRERAPESARGCRKIALWSLPPKPAAWDVALMGLNPSGNVGCPVWRLNTVGCIQVPSPPWTPPWSLLENHGTSLPLREMEGPVDFWGGEVLWEQAEGKPRPKMSPRRLRGRVSLLPKEATGESHRKGHSSAPRARPHEYL